MLTLFFGKTRRLIYKYNDDNTREGFRVH